MVHLHFPLAQAADVQRRTQAQQQFGKIVLDIA
jgi:hypothetical protein